MRDSSTVVGEVFNVEDEVGGVDEDWGAVEGEGDDEEEDVVLLAVMEPVGTGGSVVCKKATQGRTTSSVRARFMGR